MSDWKDDARRRAKEMSEGSTYRMNEGENTFRILPDKKGTNHKPYREIRVHRDVGPKKAFVRCGKDMDGNGECWLCKKLEVLKSSKSRAKRLQADKARDKSQLIVQVSAFDVERSKFTKAKPWWVSTGGRKSLAVTILKLFYSKRSVEDPVKGYNITIERTGTGLDTTYGTPILDEEPTKVPKSILEGMKDLDEYIPKYNAKRQEAAYNGEDYEEDDDSEEEESEDEESEDTEESEESEEEDQDDGDPEEDEDAEEESEEESEDEESDEESEDESEEEESEDESEEEESEEESEDEEEEEEEEQEEEEDPEPEPEEEEEEPKPKNKKGKASPSKPKPKPAPKPAPKGKPPAKPAKPAKPAPKGKPAKKGKK